MDEDKNKKPLLSYEQVIEIIDECVSRDEADGRDERIVRVEKAAEELEAEYRKKVLHCEKKKKRRCSLKWFCKRLFRCIRK